LNYILIVGNLSTCNIGKFWHGGEQYVRRYMAGP